MKVCFAFFKNGLFKEISTAVDFVANKTGLRDDFHKKQKKTHLITAKKKVPLFGYIYMCYTDNIFHKYQLKIKKYTFKAH